MIKSIVFDFDGMVHIEEIPFSKWVSETYNLSKDALKEFFTKEFNLCKTGKLDIKEALGKYLPKCGWDKGAKKFLKLWANYGHTNRKLIELIKKKKKKGTHCILCTNNEIYRMKHYIKNKKLDDIFDHILISSEIGFLKPKKPMLKRILKVSEAKKNEILFCDNKTSFIKIAKKFGFKTYKYKTLHEFQSFLDSKKLI